MRSARSFTDFCTSELEMRTKSVCHHTHKSYVAMQWINGKFEKKLQKGDRRRAKNLILVVEEQWPQTQPRGRSNGESGCQRTRENRDIRQNEQNMERDKKLVVRQRQTLL